MTGGSRGIGAACCLQLAAEGYAVAVNYARNAGAAAAVVHAIQSAGGSAAAFQADVASEASSLNSEPKSAIVMDHFHI